MLKFGLRQKILLSTIIPILILVLVSIITVRQLLALNRINDRIIQNNYRSIFDAQAMLKSLDNHERLLNSLSSQKVELRNRARETFDNNTNEFLRKLQTAKLNAKIEGEEELVARIEGFYHEYLLKINNIKKEQRGDTRESELMRTEARLQIRELRKLCLDLIEMNKDDMFKLNKQAQEISTRYIIWTIVITVAVIILAIFLWQWLTRLIVQPIEELTAGVAEIRQGNLDYTFRTDLPDEMGILATEFNQMTQTLRDYKQINLDKLLEEKRRTEAVIRSVGDCLIVIDNNFKILVTNPAAERVFYLLPGISQGKDFAKIIKSEELLQIIKNQIKQIQDPDETPVLPTFAWEYDRMIRHFQVKVSPVTREDGAHIGYVILLEDVTKLKEVDRMKSDFISIASHELRTPLTSVVMSLGMILDGSAGELNLNEDQKELLAAANEEAIRMKDLMNALLDISQLETGRMDMDFADVDTNWLLRSVASSFHVQAESKKIQFVVEAKEDTKRIFADFNRIVQVLNNLIGNALRYTPEGGKITLSAENQGDFVHFVVADTGKGIPKDAQQKIFQKFVQPEDDPNPGAAGLGLAVSMEIVKAHGGKIWVESELGKGAAFHFLIPASKNGEGTEMNEG